MDTKGIVDEESSKKAQKSGIIFIMDECQKNLRELNWTNKLLAFNNCMTKQSRNIVISNINSNGILRIVLNVLTIVASDLWVRTFKVMLNASKDNSVKVVVIASTGDVFCSGHNLKEINEAKKADDGGESYYLGLFKTYPH